MHSPLTVIGHCAADLLGGLSKQLESSTGGGEGLNPPKVFAHTESVANKNGQILILKNLLIHSKVNNDVKTFPKVLPLIRCSRDLQVIKSFLFCYNFRHLNYEIELL